MSFLCNKKNLEEESRESDLDKKMKYENDFLPLSFSRKARNFLIGGEKWLFIFPI